MHSVRTIEYVKTGKSFGQRARDFLRQFFERSNIHGFFYFSWEKLRFVEKFVRLTIVCMTPSYISKKKHFVTDYFGMR